MQGRTYWFLSLAAVFLLLMIDVVVTQPASLPNIIIILADDLGWRDLSVYGAPQIRTPELDRLAAEGVRFNHFYSASAVCSPSRAALLTGRYPFRSGINEVIQPHSEKGIPATEKLLPELLLQAGYHTALIGKWHLGDQDQYLPLRHGFDEFYGIPYSNNMHPLYYIDGNQRLSKPEPIQARLTRRFNQRAIDYIERNQENPFFLLLAHPMPHYPIDALQPWRGSSRDGRYGDVIEELDWSVGQLIQTLKRLGLEKRSVVFFTSDNGSWRRHSNLPLRGKKRSGWDGGFRVPLIAWGPSQFGPGLVIQRPAMMFDLYTTALQLAGLEPPRDRPIDGKSILHLLRGESAGPLGRGPLDPLYFFRSGQIDAVRSGRWKLHLGRTSRWFGRREIAPELYDLASDPKEEVNLAEARPSVVERLTKKVRRFNDMNRNDLRKNRPSFSSTARGR